MKLTARQACAIESAAAMNPELDVFVLFSCPTYVQTDLPDGVEKSIMALKNVHLRYSNPWRFTEGTPTEKFFRKGLIFKSKFSITHMSDLLRILTLWKWGGTSMNLDTVMLKNIGKLTRNFAAKEDENLVGNGVMNFESYGFGHYIADSVLKDLIENFQGDLWAHNGPICLTRVLANKICKLPPMKMNADNCHGFHSMPTSDFYAISYPRYKWFFEERFLEDGKKLVADSICIHVWNKLLNQRFVIVGSKVLYGVIAEQYCPKVYSSCGDWF